MKRLATFAVISVLVAACSSGPLTPGPSAAPTPGSTASPTVTSVASAAPGATVSTPTQPPASPSAPVGLIAIGHSGLTGEGTGARYQPVPENSWATGTSEAVDSVYLRLLAARPETRGHVANTARGGASANTLASQADEALRSVPTPALAIVSTIDNDIRCDGTDDEHIPEFGADVLRALHRIGNASPEATILVVGQAGRPSTAYIKLLIAHDPSVKSSLTGTGMCDFFDPDGKLVEANFKTLTSVIDKYEAEEARVCASVPHCHTDGGVRKGYVDKLENFSADWAHANVRGQAAAAALIWPVVVSVLGL